MFRGFESRPHRQIKMNSFLRSRERDWIKKVKKIARYSSLLIRIILNYEKTYWF